jgi:TetR/AcrR family transcriptional regulator, transcriptional repressor of aconitase
MKRKGRMSAKDRKQAIVMAALPLFARRGYAETTTRDLAKAAGVSEPLLYKHFPSKEALYLEIQKFCCQGNDPVSRKLAEMVSELEPCASTLVYLVYYLARLQILGKPAGAISSDTRQRLMLKSLLEDGVFARVMYQDRFDCFCCRIEACLDAAVASGEAVKSPIAPGNRGRFAHHLAAWLAAVRLPAKSAINYKATGEGLVDQAVWFILRGMGMTDLAIKTYFNPKALSLFFRDDQTKD